jgi:hypothetical protein
MPLKKEMAAIIITWRWAAGVMVQKEIRVYIRLSATAIAEIS